MPTTWLSFRVFINPADPERIGDIEDYIALLREVVHPLIAEFEPVIGRYHFQLFVGPYQYYPEDGGVLNPIGVQPNDIVQFIRLRIEADAAQEWAIHDRLLMLCQEAPSCRGWERPALPYHPQAELGKRFGPTRVDAVAELLHGASRLALLFATDGEPYDPTTGQGGGAGVMHLLSSTLRYVVPGYVYENGMYHRMPLPCVVMDWQRELRYTSYPLP